MRFTVRAGGIVEGRVTTIGEATGEIVEHEEVVEVEIVRPAAASVEGTVVAGDGETPIPRARVELRSEDGLMVFRSTLADDSGFFQFENAFQAGEAVLLRAIFPADTSKFGEEPVTASDPGELVMVAVQIPVSVVKGRVLESDETTPVAAALVELLEDDFGRVTTTANDFGEFVFLDAPSGGFELFAEDGFGLAAFVRTELPAGEPLLVQDVILPQFGTIEGTVTDTLGIPLANNVVVLRNANLRASRQITPDPSGFFRFERVALGSFSLTYEEPTGVFVEMGEDRDQIFSPGNVTSRLETLGEIATADIMVPDGGTIFGQVLDSGGLPNTTSVTELEGRRLETRFGIFGIEIFSSSIDGTYRQIGIPAGEITVNTLDGDAAGAATATVVAGAENEINVTLGTATALPVTLDPSPGLSFGFDRILVDGSIRGDGGDGSFDLSKPRSTTSDSPFSTPPPRSYSAPKWCSVPSGPAGLDYTRKVLVADDSRFVRHLDDPGEPASLRCRGHDQCERRGNLRRLHLFRRQPVGPDGSVFRQRAVWRCWRGGHLRRHRSRSHPRCRPSEGRLRARVATSRGSGGRLRHFDALCGAGRGSSLRRGSSRNPPEPDRPNRVFRSHRRGALPGGEFLDSLIMPMSIASLRRRVAVPVLASLVLAPGWGIPAMAQMDVLVSQLSQLSKLSRRRSS